MNNVESEYSSLREELILNSTRIADWTKFSIVTTVALLGYALGDSQSCGDAAEMESQGFAWVVALLPMLVVLPAVILSLNHKFQIVRIATYIRVRFEKTHPYESHLWKFRENGGFPHPSFEMGSWGMVFVVGFACLAASLIIPGWSGEDRLGFAMRYWITGSCGVAWAVFSVWVIRQSRRMQMGENLESRMATRWTEIEGVQPSGDASGSETDR